MAGIPGWEDDPEAWERLKLGGAIMPGYWLVECPAKRKLDTAKADGEDGEAIEDKGYAASDLTLTVKITQEDWEEYQVRLKDLHPRKKGGTRSPLEIEHPVPNLMGVTRIYIHEIGTFTVIESGDEFGVGTQTFKAKEWFPSRKKVKTTSGKAGHFKSAQQVIEGPGSFYQPLTQTTDRALIGDEKGPPDEDYPNGAPSFADFLNNAI